MKALLLVSLSLCVRIDLRVCVYIVMYIFRTHLLLWRTTLAGLQELSRLIFFRYCVLLIRGDVYADMDVLLQTNLDDAIANDIGFMTPIDEVSYYVYISPRIIMNTVESHLWFLNGPLARY